MCRPLEPIWSNVMEKSKYENVRLQSIEEREAEHLRIFGTPCNLDHLKY